MNASPKLRSRTIHSCRQPPAPQPQTTSFPAALRQSEAFARKLNPMRKIFVAVFFMTHAVFGGDPGTYIEQPNLVGMITEALVASKLDHLTPHTFLDGNRQFSYHLKSVSYLGTIEHGSEKYLLATALFLRSSARGSEYPPARAHGFLLCLSTDFRLVSHCRLDYPDVELVGTTLSRQKQNIGDFTATDEATRRHGYLIDGDDFLPYPFADKVSDPQASQAKKPDGEQFTPADGHQPHNLKP